MKPAKKRPQAAATAGADAKGKSRQRFSAKSTKSEAQRQRILAALTSGPKTSYDLRRLGAYQNPTRIFELRRAGHNITTSRVVVTDGDGFTHSRVALYSLIESRGTKAVR
ncbi:MAG: helix-turn-helix domain-containing protein [Burkholderiales bacterium]